MFKHVPLNAIRLKAFPPPSFCTSALIKQTKSINKLWTGNELGYIQIQNLTNRCLSQHQTRLYSSTKDDGPWADLDAALDESSTINRHYIEETRYQSNPSSPVDIQAQRSKTWSEYMGVENDDDSPWASLDAFADGNRSDQKVHDAKSVQESQSKKSTSMSDWEAAAIAAADAYAAKRMANVEQVPSPTNQTSHIALRTEAPRLTHIDEHQNDRAAMVDVSSKEETKRVATATCRVYIPDHVLPLLDSTQPIGEDGITDPELKNVVRLKGPVMHTAQLAGIMAAKKTSELIPLCHGLHLSHVDVQLKVNRSSDKEYEYPSSSFTTFIEVTCTTTTLSQTGVEMEALTGASVTSLTLWDMLKSVAGKEMRIDGLMVTQKSGGKSGEWKRTI